MTGPVLDLGPIDLGPIDGWGGAALVPPPPALPFDAELYTYLASAVPGVTVYPGHIPQKATLPAVSYFILEEEPSYTLARAAGLTWRVYQFSAESLSYLTTAQVELALRQVLHGFRGFMGSTWVSSCRLQQCLDMPYETNVDASDDGTFMRAVEYRIGFREPIPVLY